MKPWALGCLQGAADINKSDKEQPFPAASSVAISRFIPGGYCLMNASRQISLARKCPTHSHTATGM